MLKQTQEFQRVYRKGKSAHAQLLVLFFLPDPHRISVGFTASKKVGNAVARNRAKRRMRALMRTFEPRLVHGSYVLVAKAGTVDAPYALLEKAFEKLLRQVGAYRE